MTWNETRPINLSAFQELTNVHPDAIYTKHKYLQTSTNIIAILLKSKSRIRRLNRHPRSRPHALNHAHAVGLG
jgi:hypothetical protein